MKSSNRTFSIYIFTGFFILHQTLNCSIKKAAIQTSTSSKQIALSSVALKNRSKKIDDYKDFPSWYVEIAANNHPSKERRKEALQILKAREKQKLAHDETSQSFLSSSSQSNQTDSSQDS